MRRIKRRLQLVKTSLMSLNNPNNTKSCKGFLDSKRFLPISAQDMDEVAEERGVRFDWIVVSGYKAIRS